MLCIQNVSIHRRTILKITFCENIINCFFLLYMFFFTFLEDDDDLDTNRLATAPRLGTTMRSAAAAANQRGRTTASTRPRTTTGRALTGMVSR